MTNNRNWRDVGYQDALRGIYRPRAAPSAHERNEYRQGWDEGHANRELISSSLVRRSPKIVTVER
jgi:hypothetical protein